MARYEVELTDDQARAFEKTWPPRESFSRGDGYALASRALADAIREQRKPAEPTEFGAMVKDRDGVRWLRSRINGNVLGHAWVREGGALALGEFFTKPYADIDVVEVIRGGAS